MSLFDVGDLVPLTLLVPEGDNTTGATVTYLPPSGSGGTVSPAPTTSDGGKTWTASHLVSIAGTWIFTWSITGLGAGTEHYTVEVTDSFPLPWFPSLRDVADLVPSRTVPINNTSDIPLMTFNNNTVPNAEQVARQIRAAVHWVTSFTGDVHITLYGNAQDVAALRTAGMVELSYPDRNADINVGESLLREASRAVNQLQEANSFLMGTDNTIGNTIVPQWSMPAATLVEDVRTQRTSDWGGLGSWSW